MIEYPAAKNPRKRLFRRTKHRRLKSITMLPSLVTLLNGVCGFAAIVFASQAVSSPGGQFSFYRIHLPYFVTAGYMIFLGMIADVLDGRIARMSHATSGFGGQLDSLCDVITFGVAPAFLMLKLLDTRLDGIYASSPTVLSGLLHRVIWVAAAVYMACAAIRLARFNVENSEDETAHMSFSGLPTPAAAGAVASLVLLYEDMARTVGDQGIGFEVIETIILFSLPFVCFSTAVLMVSRIRYPHIINYYLRGKKPITSLFWAVVVISIIYLFEFQRALVLAFCGFAAMGFVKWLWNRLAETGRTRHTDALNPAAAQPDTAHRGPS